MSRPRNQRGFFTQDLGPVTVLEEARQAKGIGIRTMAADLAMDDGYLSRILRGLMVANVYAALAMCQYLEVTVEEAFGDQLKQVTKRREAAR